MTFAAYKLPPPPSANKLWRVYKGRAIKSREYRAWVEAAGMIMMTHRHRRIPSPFVVRIVVVGGKDWNVQRDLDNTIKPLVDAMRHAGVIENDSTRHMVSVAASFEPRDVPVSWCCVEVEAVLKDG